MATNTAGNRLYVVGTDYSGTSSVSVHSVANDGSLTWMQDVLLPYGSSALNGIVYVSQAGGDTIYVNDNAYTNQVSAFQVASDGTLVTPSTDVNTGGSSYPYGGFWGAPGIRAGGGYLFVPNGNASSAASNDITVFKINADGSLTPVTGSPFKFPNGEYTSGSIALDTAHHLPYAGTQYGHIVKFSVGSDGTLTSLGASLVGTYGTIDGMDLRPDGSTLVAADPNSNRMVVVDTASMRPLVGSPVYGDTYYCAGVLFDSVGARLFVGNATYNSPSVVSVYSFTQTPVLPPLAIQLKVTGATVDKTGAITISGTITSSDPLGLGISLTVRQKQGHSVVTVNNSVSVNTVGLNGTATWMCKVSSSTQAFKSGAAEIIASTSANDPVTNVQVTASLDQAVQLGGK
jgi:hypothetical protein